MLDTLLGVIPIFSDYGLALAKIFQANVIVSLNVIQDVLALISSEDSDEGSFLDGFLTMDGDIELIVDEPYAFPSLIGLFTIFDSIPGSTCQQLGYKYGTILRLVMGRGLSV